MPIRTLRHEPKHDFNLLTPPKEHPLQEMWVAWHQTRLAMEEIWKDIPGQEGRYQVSSMGRARSLDHNTRVVRRQNGTIISDTIHKFNGRNLVLSPNSSGYMHFPTSGEQRAIHRLVAQLFIPNPENKIEVNHKNGDKTDNSVTNLEWVTRHENQIHRARVLKIGIMRGSSHFNSKLTEDDVLDIRMLWKFGASTKELIRCFGVTKGIISGIINRKSWKHI